MMLLRGPEKRWDYQCTKPRKRKNVFALLFLLLLYSSRGLGTLSKRTNGRGLLVDWHLGRLALPLCVLLSVALLFLRPAAAADNVVTNNTDNYIKDGVASGAVPAGQSADVLLVRLVKSAATAAASATAASERNHSLHRLRYATHSAGVYSSQLQHLEDEDDYIDNDDEGPFAAQNNKKNATGKSIQ